MSDEQVKGIPEDLREQYALNKKWLALLPSQRPHSTSNLEAVFRSDCVQMAERIARSEQALAALEGRNAELKAALRRLIGACVRPNGMLQPPDVDSEYAARAALAAPDGQKEK